ncbi:MAG: polyprenyl diphosphate synthase [Alphaproteobacteria bacterium]|nr:polyprenyl diphosphate synthase [Alphaproteobacteria bacterium]MCL2758529.1 polyprenyl diphosphate synthase [Alphaproteobacteria bacterium]
MLKLFKKKSSSKRQAANHADAGRAPHHIAFICDGNRSWAKKRGMPAMHGHRRAADGDISKMVDWFIARGVNTFTFFIFSTENWTRSKEEVDFLMKLFGEVFDKNYKEAKEKNLRFKVIGRRDRIAKTLVKKIEKLEAETDENTGGTVVFALDYGGHDEIVRAVQSAIESGIPASDVDIDTFETFMDTGDLLPIDMVVRTSNEQRISNFLLWKLAYAELSFVSEQWPEYVNNEKLWQKTLDEFAHRNRRFGGGAEKNYSGKKSK